MRGRVLKLFLLFSGLLFITACGDSIDNDIEKTDTSIEGFTEKTYSQTVNGIVFNVVFDREGYIAGDNITVTASAENVSGKELRVWADTSAFGKNGALQIGTYIDGEEDYISNSRDGVSFDDEYEGVLENKESIRCSITFYTDTIVELTAEDYLDVCVYLCVINQDGERDTISIMVPVDIDFGEAF